MSFLNDVMPVLTKFGCNAGACHGKARGQNGFQLSLLGFDPNFDYESLVMESRGRRIFPFAPQKSLLLEKPFEEISIEMILMEFTVCTKRERDFEAGMIAEATMGRMTMER